MAVDVTLRNIDTNETDSESVDTGCSFFVDESGNLIINNDSGNTEAIYKVGYWISVVRHEEDGE